MQYVVDECARLMDEAAHAAWRHEPWAHYQDGLCNLLGNVHVQWAKPNLSWTIQHLLDLTEGLSDNELIRLWHAGELPTGVRDFIIACRKADKMFKKP